MYLGEQISTEGTIYILYIEVYIWIHMILMAKVN